MTLVSHPVESVKAVGKLASNPVLNPIGGTALALAQGKNPATAYKDGFEDVKEIGSGLLDGYKKTYKDHGIAGLAGSIAPDVVLAIASGGSSTAVEGAAEVGGKAVATGLTKEVAKETAKNVAKKVAQGPEDVLSTSVGGDVEPNFLENFIANFEIP